MEYRNELKYICSEQDIRIMQARISSVMQHDFHQTSESGYHIRSIYFDNYENRCMYENEAGIDTRKKFRIRIYDCRDDFIRLEVKYKVHGMTKKEYAPLTLQQFHDIMDDKIENVFRQNNSKAVNMLYLSRMTEYMRPKVLVAYDRDAWICTNGNVRVTFDRNIVSSGAMGSIFEKKIPSIPVLDVGKHILEIKYDEYLPDYIVQALGMQGLRQTAFSKYFLCRTALSSYL